MKLKIYTILALGLLCSALPVHGQKVAVKTNLLYDATATINAGVEVGLAPRWTLDVSGNFNGWVMSHGRRWKHFLVQPEARYWLCDRFAGHFLGIHLHGGTYNAGGLKNSISFLGTDLSPLSDNRFQGWFWEQVRATATTLCWANTGTWRWKSASAMPTPAMTSSGSRVADGRQTKTCPTTTSGLRKQPLV